MLPPAVSSWLGPLLRGHDPLNVPCFGAPPSPYVPRANGIDSLSQNVPMSTNFQDKDQLFMPDEEGKTKNRLLFLRSSRIHDDVFESKLKLAPRIRKNCQSTAADPSISRSDISGLQVEP